MTSDTTAARTRDRRSRKVAVARLHQRARPRRHGDVRARTRRGPDLLEGAAFYHYAVPLLTVGYQNFTPDEFAAVLEWDLLEMIKKGSTTVLEESFGAPRSLSSWSRGSATVLMSAPPIQDR